MERLEYRTNIKCVTLRLTGPLCAFRARAEHRSCVCEVVKWCCRSIVQYMEFLMCPA